MQLTLSQYLKNPYGRGASFANIKSQIDDLDAQFKELDSQFIIKIYKYRSISILHIVVPSKHKEDVTYDVVYEIDLSKLNTEDVTIDNISMKVFSNCPSFIFTYANAFRKYNLLCRWLENKYRPEVKKVSANIKNPYDIIGLDRSMYLSMKYIKQHSFDVITVIKNVSSNVTSYSEVARKIRTQDQIMDHYKSQIHKEDLPSNDTTKPKNLSENERDSNISSIRPKNRIHSTKSTSSMKTIKSTKKISKANKSVKSVKKI